MFLYKNFVLTSIAIVTSLFLEPATVLRFLPGRPSIAGRAASWTSWGTCPQILTPRPVTPAKCNLILEMEVPLPNKCLQNLHLMRPSSIFSTYSPKDLSTWCETGSFCRSILISGSVEKKKKICQHDAKMDRSGSKYWMKINGSYSNCKREGWNWNKKLKTVKKWKRKNNEFKDYRNWERQILFSFGTIENDPNSKASQ